jgi:hypothetical protein
MGLSVPTHRRSAKKVFKLYEQTHIDIQCSEFAPHANYLAQQQCRQIRALGIEFFLHQGTKRRVSFPFLQTQPPLFSGTPPFSIDSLDTGCAFSSSHSYDKHLRPRPLLASLLSSPHGSSNAHANVSPRHSHHLATSAVDVHLIARSQLTVIASTLTLLLTGSTYKSTHSPSSNPHACSHSLIGPPCSP